MLKICQEGAVIFCLRLCLVSAVRATGWGLEDLGNAACGERVGMEREGLERTHG